MFWIGIIIKIDIDKITQEEKQKSSLGGRIIHEPHELRIGIKV
jgi:hypothetical protein